MSDTGTRRGRSALVQDSGHIVPTGLDNIIHLHPIEDNSKHTPSVEEDLMLAVAGLVLQDLDDVFLLDTTNPETEQKQKLLCNWWGARAYVYSEFFESDCQLAGIDVDAARERLAPKIKRGRECYGRWVRTVPTINLPIENEEDTND